MWYLHQSSRVCDAATSCETGAIYKSVAASVNWNVEGLKVWECDVITLCEEERWLTGPGPRWIGCRIKGSPILTTNPRAQSHTCKGQRKEIPPLLYWKVSNQRLLLGDFTYIGLLWAQTFAFKSFVISSWNIIIRTLPPRPSPPYLFSKQSKFVGGMFAHKVYLDLV